MTQKTSANIRQVLTRRCAALGVPVSATFELTPRCNLRCRMCYVRLTPEQMAPIGRELTASEWLDFAAQAKEAGLVFLLLTGGEPTLRPDFPEIYEGLSSMGLSISINTNGTLLTPQLRDLWHRLPPAQVNVTLYGLSREDYQAVCGDGNAFDRMEDALRWLKQEGILTHLNTTIIPENLQRLRNMEDYARQLGLELRVTSYCFPPSRRDPCTGFTRLTAEQAAEAAALDLLWREGSDVLCRRAKELSAPPQASCESDTGEQMQCLAAKSQFWMTWNGIMTPCGMLPEPAVLPMDTDFSSAWTRLKDETSLIHLCPECTACEYRSTCMHCAAVTYTETGRFDGKPEYMCRFARAYRKALERLADQPPAQYESQTV